MARGNTKKAPAKQGPAPKVARTPSKAVAKAKPPKTVAVAKARPPRAAAVEKTKPPKAAAVAKAPSMRAARTEDAEPSDTELMLQTLACPTSTADRLSELCEAAVLRTKEDLSGIAAADLVWRKRPEREAVSVAIQGLANELQRHGEVMVALYEQLRNIAEDEADHGDLEIPDVIERLRPLLNSLSPEE